MIDVSASLIVMPQSRESKCRKVEGDSPRLLCFLTLENYHTLMMTDCAILVSREQIQCIYSLQIPIAMVMLHSSRRHYDRIRIALGSQKESIYCMEDIRERNEQSVKHNQCNQYRGTRCIADSRR